LLICGGIIYIIFADSSEQAWSNGKIRNSHKKRENELGEEMKELNNKNLSSVREIL
jgi:hypothetical protein